MALPGGEMTWADLDDLDEDEILTVDLSVGLSGATAPVEANDNNMKRIETEVDADGIKTVTEFSKNPRGKTVKTVKRVKVQQKEVEIPKVVLARRELKKFGDCAGAPPGPEEGKTDLDDELFVIPSRKSRAGDKKAAKAEETFQLNIVCRKCGKVGDHWTSKCPFRDRLDDNENMADAMDSSAAAAGEGDGKGGDSSTTSNRYVPPGMRGGGGDRPSYRDRDDSNTIRVTNISEDTKEADLQDLVRPFGRPVRLFLAKDKRTGLSRGFAFITFERREDAEKAIQALDGYGYDHLVLRAHFSKKRD